MEWLIFRIASQIKNKVNDLAAREDSPARIYLGIQSQMVDQRLNVL